MSEELTPLWTPAELVKAVRGAIAGRAPAEINGISIDSRSVARGDLFIALIGPHRDGHDFVIPALDAGAAGALVSRIPAALTDDPGSHPLILVDDTQTALERLGDTGRVRSAAQIVAITGSVGKTSTKEMLARALAGQAPTHWSVGSFNNHWGVPLSLARLPRESAYAVFELGMNHAGEIAALTRQVRPDIAIITTIAPAHLEFFDSVDSIADAKAEIFLGMSGAGMAILNRDNPWFDRLAAAAVARGLSRIIPFGEHETAAARLISLDASAADSRVTADILGKVLTYRLGQPGRHLVINSLAVLAAVSCAGADLAQAAETFADFQALAGRGRRSPIQVPGGAAVLIDESYNASPAAMRAAFDVLAQTAPGPAGRRLVVLGDMLELGPDGPALHAALAEPIAAARIDLVFACGPLNRHLFDAVPAARQGAWAPDAASLAPIVIEALRPGDVVTVKGSLGSRMAEIVKPLLAGHAAQPAAGVELAC